VSVFRERQDNGDKVTYSAVKNNWYVVSGVDASGNVEFYKKLIALPPLGEDQEKAADEETPVFAKTILAQS
jgi:hypothetical protein